MNAQMAFLAIASVALGVAWLATKEPTPYQCRENDADPKCAIMQVREEALERAIEMEKLLRLIWASPEKLLTADELEELQGECRKATNVALIVGQRFKDEKLEAQGMLLKEMCGRVLG